ncbi:uncharacterized protein [Watersipora subatra]|uniref:uncharacterized protein n=1 Tax=Watersipora subatra TaxID=2589382 RepID=UPI00355B9732
MPTKELLKNAFYSESNFGEGKYALRRQDNNYLYWKYHPKPHQTTVQRLDNSETNEWVLMPASGRATPNTFFASALEDDMFNIAKYRPLSDDLAFFQEMSKREGNINASTSTVALTLPASNFKYKTPDMKSEIVTPSRILMVTGAGTSARNLQQELNKLVSVSGKNISEPLKERSEESQLGSMDADFSEWITLKSGEMYKEEKGHAAPDQSAAQVKKIIQAINQSYKALEKGSGQRVVVAYSPQNGKESAEEAMLRTEAEKLGEELKIMKKLSAKVKNASDLLEQKKKYNSDSHKVINAILKLADSLLAKNKPEISINIGEEETSEAGRNGWSDWTTWSDCTMQCGLHSYQFKHRICIHSGHCPGESKERKQCFGLPKCVPEAGVWSSWSHWTQCSASCGVGTKKSYRSCQIESGCEGKDEMTEKCFSLIPCSEDDNDEHLQLSDGWSRCSVSCGSGIQYRANTKGRKLSRTCQGQTSCDSALAHWQNWQAWGACTVTCGLGVRVKSRICLTRTPAATCHGSGMHTEACTIPCNSHRIPDVDPLGSKDSYQRNGWSGTWSEWTDWTSCSVSCGIGVEIKYRRCRGQCYGNFQQRRPCVKDSCDFDNVGYAERLLEGDSTKLGCPVEDIEDSGEVIWVSPDGMRIDNDSKDKRFKLLGKTLEIIDARSATAGTYHCIVSHSSTGIVQSGDVSLAVTTCDALPCKHGGTCEEQPNELITWMAFTCHCPAGTIGTFCELKLSYSTQFWILTAIITSCSMFCLCFAIFAISWKEQLEDHGSRGFNIATYLNNVFANGGCKLLRSDNHQHSELVRLDVSRPEGRGWLSRLCRLLQCNRKPPELPVVSENSFTESTSSVDQNTSFSNSLPQESLDTPNIPDGSSDGTSAPSTNIYESTLGSGAQSGSKRGATSRAGKESTIASPHAYASLQNSEESSSESSSSS